MFQCEKKYCDEKCEFGFKLDDYGCETCDCVDPCHGVECGDSKDLRQGRLWYVHITNDLESLPSQGQTNIFLQYTSVSISTVPSNVRSVTCWTCTAVRRVSASTRARMCTVARTRSASTAFAVRNCRKYDVPVHEQIPSRWNIGYNAS